MKRLNIARIERSLGANPDAVKVTWTVLRNRLDNTATVRLEAEMFVVSASVAQMTFGSKSFVMASDSRQYIFGATVASPSGRYRLVRAIEKVLRAQGDQTKSVWPRLNAMLSEKVAA